MLRIRRVFVKMVFDKADPRVGCPHISCRLRPGYAAFAADDGDSIFQGRQQSYAQRRVRREDLRRSAADDHALATSRERLKRFEQATEVGRSTYGWNGSDRLDALLQPACRFFVGFLKQSCADAQICGQFLK